MGLGLSAEQCPQPVAASQGNECVELMIFPSFSQCPAWAPHWLSSTASRRSSLGTEQDIQPTPLPSTVQGAHQRWRLDGFVRDLLSPFWSQGREVPQGLGWCSSILSH